MRWLGWLGALEQLGRLGWIGRLGALGSVGHLACPAAGLENGDVRLFRKRQMQFRGVQACLPQLDRAWPDWAWSACRPEPCLGREQELVLGPVLSLGQSVGQGFGLAPVPLVDAGGRPVPAKGRAVRCLNRLRHLPCRQWAWQERLLCRKMPRPHLSLCLKRPPKLCHRPGPSLRREGRSLCRLRRECRLCLRQ